MKSNSDIHSYMEKLLQEALKWTAKLNGNYHTESVIMCGLERMLPFFRVTIEEGAIIAAGAVVGENTGDAGIGRRENRAERKTAPSEYQGQNALWNSVHSLSLAFKNYFPFILNT